MEYLDFSSVITTIRKYISDAHNMNQIDMMYQLFVSFLNSEESKDFDFDNGLVCRWFNGQAKISPRITGYYMDNHKRNLLAADMHRNVLPLMYDSAMAVQEVYNILVQDTTISDKAKEQLLQNYPFETELDEANLPILLHCRSRYRMDLTQDATGFQTVHILLGIRKCRYNFFRISTIDPALDRIHAFITDAELDRLTHGNTKSRYLFYHIEFRLFLIVFCQVRDTQKVLCTVFIGYTVFFII